MERKERGKAAEWEAGHAKPGGEPPGSWRADYRPTVFWAWNGDMRDEDIAREIAEFEAAGIGGLHVHARAGLTIDYLGEEWFRAWATAVEHCKKRGVKLWIYDEQGWPSGFAGGAVPARGEAYQLKYLERSDRLTPESEGRVLAAYRRGPEGWQLAERENADMYVYYAVQEHYADLLNPDAVEEFLCCTHERYRLRLGAEFGTTILGVFTDEPQIHVSGRAWSRSVAERYEQRYGESVYAGLYLLWGGDGPEEAERARLFRWRYYETVRELFTEGYTRRIYGWCANNGLLLTGHFAAEDGLCIQTASNTGVMPHYEYMHVPGIDHLGRRLNPYLLMKQVQSVSHQFGMERVLSETYACTGNGVSFTDLARIWFHQAAFGINLPCLSISMHSLAGVRKRDYPVFFSPQQPWWGSFPAFSAFLRRVSEFVSVGAYRPDVLVISAVNSALCEPVYSETQKNVSADYRVLVENLVALQIPFDIGDERLLARHGGVDDGMLTCGAGRYRIAVLPRSENLCRSTLDLLQRFVSGGGRVACVAAPPARYDGAVNGQAEEAFQSLGAQMLQNRRGILEKYFARIGYERGFWVTDFFGKLDTQLVLTHRKEGKTGRLVLFNPSPDCGREVHVCGAAEGTFLRVHPQTGEEAPLSTVFDGAFSYAPIRVCAGEGVLLKFMEGAAPAASPPISEQRSELELSPPLRGENALVVDYARYRRGDEEFSDPLPVVRLSEKLYGEADKRQGSVRAAVEYRFISELTGPAKVALAAETAKAVTLTVNGREVPLATQAFYLDRAFRRYDIGHLVQRGENRVLLEYDIPPLRLGFALNEAHDAVRNKFSYPVEAESIYLVGDFDVAARGRLRRRQNCLTVEGGGSGFALADAGSERVAGCWDITESGGWFYAGNAAYTARVEGPRARGERVHLHLERYAGTAARVRVNGKEAGTVFLADRTLELTERLAGGSNLLEIELLGSLRNLLGPHHHFRGETEITGVHTFTGEYGNGAVEDLVSWERPDTVWTDDYSFIRFGIERAEIIRRREKSGGKV